ncbi:AMP-binding protein [Pseudohongiella spirulinae]|uniref:AMP-dependent synthetase/ligase domain-containing protein n=1 Tax=Pseudohongiella spirulinae TaxID=1249552 RepID=A0A0S2KEU9_9GAMM|nr:AMP-binding protein [Pseudohongiella spirulinae]ALO46848.1 hypothetical protein PS2015_2213 [Pseudohongiella spirulinae]
MSVNNLGTILQSAAHSAPHRIQYSFLNRRGEISEQLNCLQLYTQAENLAKRLRQFIGPQQSVALLMLPEKEFVVSFWACLLAEIRPAPMSRQRGQTPADIVDQLTEKGIAAVLTKDSLRTRVENEVPAFSIAQLMERDPSNCQLSFSEVNSDEPAFIQFSSGSTRQPRGIVISHKNVLHNLACIHKAFAIGRSDAGLCWLPLHHDMGLIGHVLQPVFSGIQNYFMTPINFIGRPQSWLRNISRYGVSISGAPAFAYRLCTVSEKFRTRECLSGLDLSSWRLAYCGSEKIDADVLRVFAEQWAGNGFKLSAFYPCYGLAESTLFVSGRQGIKRDIETGQVSVGKPAATVCIVNPNTGKFCPSGQCGEILIRSDSVAKGYFRSRVSTEATFDRILPGLQGNYMRSGDLGFLTEGELYISGRLKNVIKIRGRQIQAEDLEASVLLGAQQDDVWLCAVLPVMADGAEGLAVMVETTAPDPDALNARIRAAVSAHADVLPACIVHVRRGRIPLTSSGKVRRSALANLLDELTPNSIRSLS